MHKFGKTIAENLKREIEAVGMDNMTPEQVCQAKEWSEIAKNITCAEKDYLIVDSMEKATDDENRKAYKHFDEDWQNMDDDRRFYDHYRYANGRFAPKGRGSYRAYTDFRMTPEDYHNDKFYGEDMDTRMYSNRGMGVMDSDSMNHRGYSNGSHMRDMDRYYGGRMYYTEDEEMAESKKSKSDLAKEKFMKSKNAQDMEQYITEIFAELGETSRELPPDMRTMFKQKTQNAIARM